MRLRVVFTGRKAGAIGVFGFCVVDTEAPDAESAILKCYETHDHIMFPTVIDLATGTTLPTSRDVAPINPKDWK